MSEQNCISCNEHSSINIRNVNFCNKCFTNKLTKKVRQEINLIKEQRLLIISNGDKNTSVMLHVLHLILKYKVNQQAKVLPLEYETHKKFYDDCNFSIEHDLEINFFFKNNGFIEQNAIKKIKENYDVILRSLVLDDIANDSIYMIIQGKGKDAVKHCKNECDDIKEYRPMRNVTKNELDIYYNIYKNEILLFYNETKNNAIKQEVSNLITELSENNYSTSYNIIETLKKLN
ncbi:hypothetical protein COBT_000047 [Conglomerata obtusa]